ncbi:hypothetical protein CC1G_00716 [Coprinopsis cinerea okayama7|uniref:Uncharacterized protein n=1 Tax=Coprinopsis cinerea (strain Okayama-7 / 130 / ATCC MYA-4618 / FGSC 9003) TaxID=240176 RepID=A8N3U6_COPC7|nr:hypothetical protein CC1G_00716 [Coprinopsis cinerea okayama7\|eukprot:XP_001829537.1 hypothetical protein CC1G_00716 [Coprinopsis cinerea okayama7\
MPKSPRKRGHFTASYVYDAPNNENDQRDFRRRRQGTGSTSSIETVRAHPSSSKPKPLSEQPANGQQRQDAESNTSHKSDYSSGILTSKAIASLKQPLHTLTKLPTRIPIKPKSERGNTTVRKLEPPPPSTATPILPKPSTGKEPPTFFEDAEGVKLDVNPLPSIPNPTKTPHDEADSAVTNEVPKITATTSNLRPPSEVFKRAGDSFLFPTYPAKSSISVSGPDPPALTRTLKRAKKVFPMDSDSMSPPSQTQLPRKDEYGCYHLGASGCQLFVSFPHTPHYEVWDMPDDGVAPCPAELYIMTRDYQQWDSVPLAIPDVALMHIECRTKATSSRYSEHSRDQDHWRVVFDGSEMPSTKGSTPANIPADSISVEYKWDRIYSMPTVGKGCKGNFASSSSSSTASTPPTIPMTLSPSKLLPTFFYTPPSTAAPGRGWVMRFWIPVPLHLFLKKETRVFEISAKVWLAPNSPKPKRALSKFSPPSVSTELGDIDADFIEASTEMTVSHLRKEREMVSWL